MTTNSDTIDLIKILATIVKNFKTIIFILLLGLLMAVIVTENRNPKVTGTVEIFPITKMQNSALYDYAFVINSSVRDLKNLAQVETEFFAQNFSNEKLFSKFIGTFSNLQIVREKYMSIHGIDEVKSLSDKFEISRKFVGDVPKHYITFKSRNPVKDLSVLNDSFIEINKEIFEEMRNYGLDLSASINRHKIFTEKKLMADLDIIKEKYLLKLSRQLSFLNEHKMIALKLDIKMMNKEYVSQIEESIFSQDFSEIDEFYADNLIVPYYLRGYEAIQEEINMISDRNLNNIEIYDLEYAKTLIELQSTSAIVPASPEFIDEILDNDTDFKAAIIDLNQVKYSQTLTNTYLYIIILICALAFSIIFVVVRESYQQYTNK